MHRPSAEKHDVTGQMRVCRYRRCNRPRCCGNRNLLLEGGHGIASKTATESRPAWRNIRRAININAASPGPFYSFNPLENRETLQTLGRVARARVKGHGFQKEGAVPGCRGCSHAAQAGRHLLRFVCFRCWGLQRKVQQRKASPRRRPCLPPPWPRDLQPHLACLYSHRYHNVHTVRTS